MNRHRSLMAVKDAIGGGQTYCGNVDVIVENSGRIYIYNDIFASVSYNIGYMQMDVALEWDDDETQVSYKKLGLHVGYNSNFQEFSLDDDYLQWQDGENCISVRFE